MRCSDLMNGDVACCIESSFVIDAAEIMRQRNVGFLPVCTVEGVVVGTITDRDIAVRVLAAGRPSEQTRVADVITPVVVSCRPDDELEIAEERMSSFQKSRIVCIDAEGRLAGVISLSDIAKLESDGAGIVAASVASRETAASRQSAPDVPGRRPLECGDVMNLDVACCCREDFVPAIAVMMRDRDIGFVPVCDEGGAIVGTLTDRDLTIRVVAAGKPPAATRAMDILTPELVYCAVDDPLTVAEDLMTEYKKSRIVCADNACRPRGVISLADIARVEAPAIVSRILRDLASAAQPEIATARQQGARP
jgi:CBS domain-containing protein